MQTKLFTPLLALAVAMTPGLAAAHTGLGAHGLFDGVLHPFVGADHVLAMVSVGLWAATLGGRAIWAVPAAFVSMMALGAALAMGGVALPGIEGMIGLSIIALGLMLAFSVRVPVLAAAALVGLFAVFHGAAHGAEMPAGASGLGYATGFLTATAVLHAAGIGLGLALARLSLVRVLGAGTALGGLWLAS